MPRWTGAIPAVALKPIALIARWLLTRSYALISHSHESTELTRCDAESGRAPTMLTVDRASARPSLAGGCKSYRSEELLDVA